MRLYQVIVLLLCVAIALNCDTTSSNVTKESCNNGLTETEKNNGYTHCCYVRFKAEKQNEVKRCNLMNQYQFKHFTDFLKLTYFEAGTDDLNIECGAAYFKFGLLSLILILL